MQSRLQSFGEAVINIVIGYGLAIATQILVFPLYGIKASVASNFSMGAIFTVVSLIRSYALRRLFNHLHRRGNV